MKSDKDKWLCLHIYIPTMYKKYSAVFVSRVFKTEILWRSR